MKTKDITICGLFAALIAIGAFLKIEIPVQPYPMHFTMQWFFVLMGGLILGQKLATISVGIYLLIGLVGVPVFASGGGPGYLLRPTFGFLLGFLLAAFVMGYMTNRQKSFSMKHMMLPATVGLFAYYGSGMVYFYFMSNCFLSKPVSWKVVFINCFLLTVFEDFVLCVLAAGLSAKLRPTFRKMLMQEN